MAVHGKGYTLLWSIMRPNIIKQLVNNLSLGLIQKKSSSDCLLNKVIVVVFN